MTNYAELVKEFHKLNGSGIDIDLTPELAVLRTRLILEEFAETYTALQEGNVIEAADGLVDTLYVLVGTAVACGLELLIKPAQPKCPPIKVVPALGTLKFGKRMLP